MSGVEVREAVIDDLPGWVECSVGLFAEDSGTRDATMSQDWPRDHSPASFRAGLADDTRLLLVAVQGDHVVGALSGSVTEPSAIRPVRVASLVSMFVRPQYRSDGVGAQLVDAFRRWARRQSADRLSVTAYASNRGALRFYRRQGFVPHEVTLEAASE
ncbi:MAG: GNAT family N-acetyltransferase [Stackebrandtia sp.]